MKLKAPKGGCTVRMYRHGLGDCFLLAFGLGADKQKYMLIDCGVLTGTDDVNATMKKVALDIKEATGGHLSVLAITHEHWDHLSGFAQAREVFDEIDVDELWLSWTEDPEHPIAIKLRERKNKAMNALRMAINRMNDEDTTYKERLLGVANFMGPEFLSAAGRMTTEETFKWAKNKWTNHKYCSPGGEPLKIKGLKDVGFYVMGPPNDMKRIRKSRPSKGQVYLEDLSQSNLYLYLDALESKDPLEHKQPFNRSYMIERHNDEVLDMNNMYELEYWRKIDTEWHGAASDLALKLDSHTNNTSLVLAIEISQGGKVLLFPGDAQVGSWLAWEDYSWKVDEDEITSQDLLERTVLYKVGHHGSHNATLKDKGLELMTDPTLSALIPVNRKMAEKRRWHMPYTPLHERLEELTSGKVILADSGVKPLKKNENISGFLKSCKEKKLYIDVTFKP